MFCKAKKNLEWSKSLRIFFLKIYLQIFVPFMSYSTRVELRNCRRTLFTIFWLGISYRGDPNRKQSILALKSQQVIFTMISYQNSNAACSKVNKVRRQFLSLTRVEYDMKDTIVTEYLWNTYLFLLGNISKATKDFKCLKRSFLFAYKQKRPF